ncbi:hypothetical protein [Ectobacillus ponti]|uniref:Uncharacterized protein n=1 Tax=Ectobacillus ponti TaxID=2961894 RepID=A0AA41XBV6_9BACI|nr:hypothetical protein [Ectobacillus ponti]MCP8970080.1 hypothetical protein [Ectobacillus ponti]
MKKIPIFIICLYCFPFVYVAMYQDFQHRSMLGYLLMVTATPLFAFCGTFFGNTKIPIAGNLLSAASSLYWISRMMGVVGWDGFFKPLTPQLLLAAVSVLNLLPQLLAIKLARGLNSNQK